MLELYKKIKIISAGIPGVVHKGVIGLCDLKELENILSGCGEAATL